MSIAFTIEPHGPATVHNRKPFYYVVLDTETNRGVAIPDMIGRGVYAVEFDIKPRAADSLSPKDLASASIFGPSHDKTLEEIVWPNPSTTN